MQPINEFLLSKNKNTVTEYSEIADELGEYRKYLTDIYSDKKHIYITFDNIHWQNINGGFSYIYIESESTIFYTFTSNPQNPKYNWQLLYDEKNKIDSYKRVGYLIHLDISKKIKWGDLKLG